MSDEDRPRPAAPAGPVDWEAVCAAYYAARQQHEDYLDQVLGPASRMAEAARAGQDAGLTGTPDISELEKQSNDLCEARQDALRQLVGVPVGDLEGQRLKFRLAYDEVLRFSDAEGFLRAVLGDLDRLAG